MLMPSRDKYFSQLSNPNLTSKIVLLDLQLTLFYQSKHEATEGLFLVEGKDLSLALSTRLVARSPQAIEVELFGQQATMVLKRSESLLHQFSKSELTCSVQFHYLQERLALALRQLFLSSSPLLLLFIKVRFVRLSPNTRLVILVGLTVIRCIHHELLVRENSFLIGRWGLLVSLSGNIVAV